MVVVERLLQAVGSAPPCGPNLEYDTAFLELARVARGRPEQQIGKSVTEGEEPDWREVATKASALFDATKDLRVALHLTKALLKTRGIAGLADGLSVIAGMLDRYWDQLHPQLDPDDDLDPTMRINALGDLNDAGTVLTWLRATPLVTVRGLGSFNLRDLAVASGELPAGEGEKAPELASIEAAFMAVDIVELTETSRAATAARDRARSIEAITAERAGEAHRADLSKLRALLDQTVKALDQRLERRGASPSSASASTAAPTNGAGPSLSLGGAISSREQVVEALDKIIQYYERHEPSSPIPMLLTRCRRLVRMSFMDIVRDIAPDAVTAVEALRGKTEGDK